MSINTIRKVDAIRAMIAAAFFASNSWYVFHILCTSWVFLMLLFYQYKGRGPSRDIYPKLMIMVMITIIVLSFLNVWSGFSLGSNKVLTNESFIGSIRLNILSIMTLISIFGSFFLISRSSLSDVEIIKILRFIFICGIL